VRTFNEWHKAVKAAGWELRPEQITAAKAFFAIPPMQGRTTLICLLRDGEEGLPVMKPFKGKK
jgi:hypothetical protein